VPSFLDDIDKAKKHFEKIEQEFRADLEKPEWKEAIEKGKMDHAFVTASPRAEPKKEEKKFDAAISTPEAGLLLSLGLIGIYIWFSRRK